MKFEYSIGLLPLKLSGAVLKVFNIKIHAGDLTFKIHFMFLIFVSYATWDRGL
jgi:hypothetical protein